MTNLKSFATSNLVEFLYEQQAFSQRVFGPGLRTEAIDDHIQKELKEIARQPSDVKEWIDTIMLGLDGAGRTGATPEQIAGELGSKLIKNMMRDWPDWRTSDPKKAIEHIRGKED